MKQYRFLSLLAVSTLVICCLALPGNAFAAPSAPQIEGDITGDGRICNSRGQCGEFSIVFDPAGGPVTGSVYVNWPITNLDTGAKIGEEVLQGTLTGTFDGGDGGAVRGTMATGQVTVTYFVTCETCTNFTHSQVGTAWEGNLRADGTGNGWIGPTDILWNVTYSVADFQAGLGGRPPATKTPSTATQTPGTPQPILQGRTIHATGQVCNNEGSCGVIELTFNTAGGPVTGSFSGTFIHHWSSGSATTVTTTEESGTLSGIFSGGDGGTLSGTASTQASGFEVRDGWDQEDYQGNNPIDGTFPVGPFNESREWNGVLNANGTGWGYVPCSGAGGVVDGYFAYTITFSAADFQVGLAASAQTTVSPTETSQHYVQQQINGISVEMGDKAWSEHELQLLNEVLGQLPPDLLDKIALQSIVRYTAGWDENGKLNPDVFGDYSPADQGSCLTCARSPQTIRIYDRGTKPFEFANDTGDTEFKATILHEMTHALQYYKNDQDVYNDPAIQNPLVSNYVNNIPSGAGVGWFYSKQNNGYYYISDPGNDPPTNYGMTNPAEDMSESVMMYVYDPQKLQNSSPQRYTYIRDKIFGGTEYENGKQKGK